MVRTPIVAALLALVVPIVLAGTGTAATSAASRGERRAASAAAHHWLARQRGALAANGFDFDSSTLTAAGRLGGRRHPSVLDERQFVSRTAGRYGLTVRDGRTGKEQWSKTIRIGVNGLEVISATPAMVGTDGTRGIVLLRLSAVPGAGTDTKVTTSLTALSGRDGSQLWSVSLPGRQSAVGDLTSVPGPVELFHDRPGPMDYLVDLSTTTDTGDATVAERISGTDGAMSQFGPSYTAAAGFPSINAVDDLDGDRLADVAVVSPGADGFVQGSSGLTATPLWTTPVGLQVEPLVTSIGHYSDPAVNDLLIEADGAAHRTYSVLAGRSGQLLWTRPADGIGQIGAAGRPLAPALDLYRQHDAVGRRRVRATVTIEAITSAGQVVYSRHRAVSVHQFRHASSDSTNASFEVRQDDVQTDGAREGRLTLSAAATHGHRRRSAALTGLVDGRTGTFHAFPAASPADGSLVHGRGTDYVHLAISHGHARLSAWDGKHRRLLYRRSVAGIAHLTDGAASGLRAAGHACSDIALSTSNQSQGVVALLTARGARQWSVAYPLKLVTGGQLHRFAPRKPACVRPR